MSDFDDKWSRSVVSALAVGRKIAPSTADLNEASEHIVQLLTDASTLLEAESHATAAFLSITAIEETSKLHLGKYRHSPESISRRKDPLYKHGEKHHLALGPTISMRERLNQAIGPSRVRELMQMAQAGELVGIRESALYFEHADRDLITPRRAITRKLSVELFLLAVEAFDDALVGYTNMTFELGEYTDQLFSRWANV